MSAKCLEFEVKDSCYGPGKGIETTITGHRDAAACRALAKDRWQRMVDAHLTPQAVAAAVPAVAAYHAKRSQLPAIDASVQQCETAEILARRKLDELMAAGDGVADVSAKIGRAEAAVNAAAAKLAEARSGASLFRETAARAEAAARAALTEHIKRTVRTKFQEELAADEKALRAKCTEVMLPLLDDLTALRRTKELNKDADTRLGGEIESALRAVPSAA